LKLCVPLSAVVAAMAVNQSAADQGLPSADKAVGLVRDLARVLAGWS
jgi:hypothetical protein